MPGCVLVTLYINEREVEAAQDALIVAYTSCCCYHSLDPLEKPTVLVKV